jgi:hypothetical protein
MKSFFPFILSLLILTGTLQAQENYTVLMLDCSGSMGGSKIADLKAGVKEFIRLSPSCTQISIYTFGYNAKIGFTKDKAILYGFVDRIKADGDTPLYTRLNDVYYDAGDKKIKGIALFTDGGPTDSLTFAINSKPPIYCIGYNLDNKGEAVLKELSGKSGGETCLATNTERMKEIFSELAVRIAMPANIDADVLPNSNLPKYSGNENATLSGVYIFEKAVVYAPENEVAFVKLDKDDLLSQVKSDIPNAMIFDASGMKLLIVDEDNKSNWSKGYYTFSKNLLNIKYIPGEQEYDIKVSVVENNENGLILNVIDFDDGDMPDISIYVYMAKDKCFE